MPSADWLKIFKGQYNAKRQGPIHYHVQAIAPTVFVDRGSSFMSMLILGAIGFVFVGFAVFVWVKRGRQSSRDQLRAFARAIEDLPTSEYLPKSSVEEWKVQHASTLALAGGPSLARFLPKDESLQYSSLRSQLRDVPGSVRAINEAFIQRRLAQDAQALNRVERYPLTARQRRSVVIDENNTFVVAGAGTGKTSTIVGKVDYLTRRGLAKPREILVLAFGRKAAEELRERFSSFEQAKAVEVSTFHAIGRQIVAQVEGRAPSLSVLAEDDRALGKFIEAQLIEQLSDPTFAYNVIRLFSDLLDETEISIDDTEVSEIQRLKSMGLRDLTDQRMKSRQEVAIANWLTLHGIAWEYERGYEYATSTPWKRQYQPDFYLTDSGIYLEHFGVDRQNRTAEHVDNAAYVQAMKWKQDLHRTHGTSLIETYSWMFDERVWTAELERQLRLHNVPIRSITGKEARALVEQSSKSLSDFVKLIQQFLSLFKSGGHTLSQVSRSAETERDRVFVEVFARIYAVYQSELESSKRIDFNDMINLARQYVSEGRYTSRFRYIVIDEFQDISANRLGLVKDLRDQQSHSRVFMVGDDWQSIYRFTGSDIGIATRIEDYLGYTERIDLDIAFRYQQEILDVSSQFVMKNPAQLRKTLTAHAGTSGELPISVVFDEGRNSQQPIAKALEVVLHEIETRAKIQESTEDYKPSVMLIGRYHFNRPQNFDELKARLARQNIELDFTTAHGSKGKEADFVIVTGLESGEYGFPSNISDDHVVRMVLSAPDSFPYGEERRLFYVALTRTKTRTYLVVPHDNASPFVSEELLDESLARYVEVVGEISARHRCPRCGERTIKRREGQYGTFWACTNYPICLGRLRTCSRCSEGAMIDRDDGAVCTSCGNVEARCPRCGRGRLLERTNRTTGATFWACSEWNGGSGCTYTQNQAPRVPVTA